MIHCLQMVTKKTKKTMKINQQVIPMSTEHSYPGLDVGTKDTQAPQCGQGGQQHSQGERLQGRSKNKTNKRKHTHTKLEDLVQPDLTQIQSFHTLAARGWQKPLSASVSFCVFDRGWVGIKLHLRCNLPRRKALLRALLPRHVATNDKLRVKNSWYPHNNLELWFV